MSLQQLIKDLEEIGCSPEQIVAAVKLEARRLDDRQAEIRERAKLKKRRQREASCPDLSRSVPGTARDISPPSSPSSSSPDGFPPAPIVLINTPPSFTPSPSPSSTPSLFRSSEAFGDFWKAYPRKVGKGAAERAWTKALKHTDADQIIEAVRAVEWPSDAEFIPHPSTWLNGKRWLDEAPARKMTFAEELALKAGACDPFLAFGRH